MPLVLEDTRILEDTQAIAEKEIERKKKIESAPIHEQFVAFTETALKSNFIAKIDGELELRKDFEPDNDWTISIDGLMGDMSDMSVSSRYANEIIEKSRSQDEYVHLLHDARRKSERDNVINETIGGKTQALASVAGSVFDIDLIAGVGVGSVFKLKTIAQAIAVTGSIETVAAVAKSQIDSSYTLADAIADIGIGVIIDSAAVRLLNGRYTNEPTNGNSIYNKMQEDIIKYGKDDTMKSEIDNIIKRGFTDIDPNIKPVKSYEVNRKAFFNKQKDINSVVLTSQLKAINDEISAIKSSIRASEDKLSKLNSKPETRGTKGAKTRLKNKLKEDKDKLQAEKNKLSQDIESNAKIKEAKELEELEQTVQNMNVELTEAVDEMSDIIRNASKEELAEVESIVMEMRKQYPSETEDMIKLFKNASGKKEPFKISSSMLKGRDKALVLGLGLSVVGASSAEAGDFSDTFEMFPIALIAVLAGAGAISKLNGVGVSGKLSAIGSKLKSSIQAKEWMKSKDGKTFNSTREEIVDNFRTSLTETITPIARTSDEAEELVHKLLFDPTSSRYSAEQIKMTEMKSAIYRYSTVENESYKSWLKDNGRSQFGSLLEESDSKIEFRGLVSDAIEGLEVSGKGSKYIQDTAKAWTKESDRIFKLAKDTGVYGFRDLEPIANYFTRLWRENRIHDMYMKTDDAGKVAIENALATALESAGKTTDKAKSQAKQMVTNFTTRTNIHQNKQEGVWNQIEGLLKEDVDRAEFAKHMQTGKDITSRGKGRINIDVNSIPEFTINIDGVPQTMNKADFVERNSLNALETLSNNMYGAIALAEHGIYSKSMLNDAINGVHKASGSEVANQLEMIGNLILGQPIPSTSPSLAKVVNALKDITFIDKLQYVSLAMPPEVLKTLFNGGLMTGIKNVARVASASGKDSMLNQLLEMTGQGTSFARHRANMRGYDASEIAMREQSFDVINRAKNISMIANLLVPASDFLTRVNLITNAERLAKYIETGKGLQKSRLESWGIDESFMEEFGSVFKRNDKGALKRIDTDGWSRDMENKFNNIMFRMGQDTTPEATMGASGFWSYSDTLGQAASALLKYPMNLYSNQGVKNSIHMDSMTMTQLVSDFAGAYVGLHARYAVQEKEVDEDKLRLYALFNVAQMGGLSTITSLGSPAIVSQMQDLTAFMNPNNI